MDETDKKIAAFITAIFLLIIAYGGYRWARGALSEKENGLTVEEGDTVEVEYVGWLSDPRIYGSERRVFDTNIEKVATDNITYPKTLTYKYHEPKPFKFTVGKGQVIKGWDKNIIGMKEGESAKWVIPPEQGYQPRLESLLYSLNRTENVPVYENLSFSEYTRIYKQPEPEIGDQITHAIWGWPAEVISVTDEQVTIFNKPAVGETYDSLWGWSITVTDIENADNPWKDTIAVLNNAEVGDLVPTQDLAGLLQDINDIKSTQQKEQKQVSDGIVVDTTPDKITIDFNSEVYGQTLVFEVTVLKITKAT